MKMGDENTTEPSDQTNTHYYKLLNWAIKGRDIVFVREYLKVRPIFDGLDANIAAELLWMIIADNDTEIATMLVEAGADVNQPYTGDPVRPSFLQILAHSCDPKKYELALLMMERGALTAAQDAEGHTALSSAITAENMVFAQELLRRDYLIDDKLIYIVVFSLKPVEWMLLIINGDHIKDAATKSQMLNDIFKWLCNFDVDDDKIMGMIEALLDIEVPPADSIKEAALCGRIDVVKLLLNRTDVDNHTKMIFLHCAVALPESSMAQMLIEWGADIEYSMYLDAEHFHRGMRPLHVACLHGSQESIQLLLHLGVEVNVTDNYGNTPFSLLNHNELSEPCRLLIKHFAWLISKGDMVYQLNLRSVSSHPFFQEFYDKCLKELQEMKDFRFFNGLSFHSIVTKNLKRLSLSMRHRQFLDDYNDNVNLFTIYRDDLNRQFEEAGKRNDFLTPMVEALYEALDVILTPVPLENIVKHLYYSDIEIPKWT